MELDDAYLGARKRAMLVKYARRNASTDPVGLLYKGASLDSRESTSYRVLLDSSLATNSRSIRDIYTIHENVAALDSIAASYART